MKINLIFLSQILKMINLKSVIKLVVKLKKKNSFFLPWNIYFRRFDCDYLLKYYATYVSVPSLDLH